MRKGKIIKGLCYTLISSLILGNISPVLAKTSVASVDETIDIKESGSSETSVYAELGSEYLVTIPKSLTLSGIDKKGTYTVSVEGDIAGTDKINVIPDETFTLNSSGLDSITASINQDKTSWGYDEILTDSKVIGNGEINASELSAGRWNGTFNFNINLKGSGITVEAKDENGTDLNASASEITGTEKEALLTSLEETGMITSKDEVDAIIEVESNEFDGIADTTFDVSSIANEGDKIAILHFDETKQEWEYISTETVDSEGKINANFSSYSPVAFVKITENGNFENATLTPGLYDANGVMLCTWEESGIDIEKDYINGSTVSNTSSSTSVYYVINNKYPETKKIIIPNYITNIGSAAFANCDKLTSITLSNNITNIGKYAFFYCNNLTNINIPNKIQNINTFTFANCKKLDTIIIPLSVTGIYKQAFGGCESLKTIYFTGSQEQWNLISKGENWNHNCNPTIIYNYTE